MNLAEIAPTRTNLLEYKEQFDFSIEGHDLLEEKREVLVMHLLEISELVKEKRKVFEEKLKKLYYQFKLLKLEFGEMGIRRILLSNAGKTGRIKITEKGVMGLSLPQIRGSVEKSEESIFFDVLTAFERTRIYDRFKREWEELYNLLIEVAELEAKAWRLAYEIKKTQRRVNALENIFIPEFKEIIKYIQESLEERERESFFQMKRVKSNKEKQVKGGVGG